MVLPHAGGVHAEATDPRCRPPFPQALIEAAIKFTVKS
jgi:hypothetical protein